MEPKFTFHIQGSAPEPYMLELAVSPSVTISCTCPAGISGIPCKHRLGVLNGETDGIIGLTPAIEEAVSAAAEAIKNSDMPKRLKDLENARKAAQDKNAQSEKGFKKYRKAVIDHSLGKGTEKQIKKASEALGEAVKDCAVAAAEVQGLIQEIRTVFVLPDFSAALDETI